MSVRVVGTVVGLAIGVILAIASWTPPQRRAFVALASIPLRVPRIDRAPVIRVPGPDEVGGRGGGVLPYSVSESGVSGKLRDLHNAPLAGVSIRIGDRVAISDSEGRFSLSLPAGSYRMWIRLDGTFHQFRVQVGQFTVLDLVAADRKPIQITPS